MKFEDEFDGLLKDALRETREAEPRLGLEGRVLAGVRASAEERRVGWWKWAAVAAMVVLIVLGIAIRRGSRVDVVRKAPQPVVVVPEKKVEEAVAPEPTRPAEPKVRAVKVAQRTVAPGVSATEEAAVKAPLLAPTPMNEQERALMLLARSNPGLLESVRKEQQGGERVVAPIRIEDIEISGIGEKEQ